MSTLRCGGVELSYELKGDPSALQRVLVLSPSNTAVREVKPYFASLFRGERAILFFDHRGTGDSEKPHRTWGMPSMQVLAADALALLDALGWSSCHVVGLSFGGMVAQEMAIARPCAISSLLLVCTSASVGRAPDQSFPIHELLTATLDERIDTMLQRAYTRRDGEWLATAEGQACRRYLAKLEEELESEPGRDEGRRWQLAARATHDTTGRLGAALDRPPKPVPAAVLAAVHDALSPPTAAVALQRIIGRRCELAWFETGHWPNLGRESADAFGSAVAHFVSEGRLPPELLHASAELEERVEWDRPLAPRGRSCGGMPTDRSCGDLQTDCVLL